MAKYNFVVKAKIIAYDKIILSKPYPNLNLYYF